MTHINAFNVAIKPVLGNKATCPYCGYKFETVNFGKNQCPECEKKFMSAPTNNGIELNAETPLGGVVNFPDCQLNGKKHSIGGWKVCCIICGKLITN